MISLLSHNHHWPGTKIRWAKDPTQDPKALQLDLVENGKDYTAIFNVPGMKKEDVNVSVEGHKLTVSAEFKDAHSGKEEGEGAKIVWKERHTGHVSRTIRIPNDVDANSISAKQDNGVLRIHFDKIGNGNKRKIDVL